MQQEGREQRVGAVGQQGADHRAERHTARRTGEGEFGGQGGVVRHQIAEGGSGGAGGQADGDALDGPAGGQLPEAAGGREHHVARGRQGDGGQDQGAPAEVVGPVADHGQYRDQREHVDREEDRGVERAQSEPLLEHRVDRRRQIGADQHEEQRAGDEADADTAQRVPAADRGEPELGAGRELQGKQGLRQSASVELRGAQAGAGGGEVRHGRGLLWPGTTRVGGVCRRARPGRCGGGLGAGSLVVQVSESGATLPIGARGVVRGTDFEG